MGFNFLPSAFHFSEPLWLWGMVALPLVWILYTAFYKRGSRDTGKLKDFADEHLLPHLLAQEEKSGGKGHGAWLPLLAWSLIWTCGLLAMAGPRWDFTEVKTFTPGRDLVILLDLSKSMDAQDIKPSRTARAHQEIEDIVKASKGTNIGLIAFATVPHLITPLSDDTETLMSLLPYLKPDLVYTQGSHLAPALEMAGQLLKTVPGDDKYVLIISDGGFDDGDARILEAERSLRSQNVRIDVMGIGTSEGAPMPDGRNGYLKKNGSLVFSRLEEDSLKRIARDGGGSYLEASYLGGDTQTFLAGLENAAAAKHETQKTSRFWEERFYVFLIPFALLLLPWFRRNASFPVVLVLFIFMHVSRAHAFDWDSLYLNDNQQGAKYLQQGQYDSAVDKFDDPYRRGVAEYKAGKYDAAAQSFQKADRPEIMTDARYNLGNAQLMSGKIEDAIKSYEDVLKINPDHANAQHNLEIAKKLLEKKQQQQNQNQQQQNQQQQEKKQQGTQDQNQDQSKQSQNGQNHQGSQEADKGSENERNKQEQKSEGEQNARNEKENENPAGTNNDNKQKEDNQQKNDESAQTGQQDKQKENEKQENEEARSEEMQEQTGEKQDQENAEQRNVNKDKKDQLENSQVAQQQKARQLKDIDADQWLDRIQNDPDTFLKNKFYIESQLKGAKKGENPW